MQTRWSARHAPSKQPSLTPVGWPTRRGTSAGSVRSTTRQRGATYRRCSSGRLPFASTANATVTPTIAPGDGPRTHPTRPIARRRSRSTTASSRREAPASIEDDFVRRYGDKIRALPEGGDPRWIVGTAAAGAAMLALVAIIMAREAQTGAARLSRVGFSLLGGYLLASQSAESAHRLRDARRSRNRCAHRGACRRSIPCNFELYVQEPAR